MPASNTKLVGVILSIILQTAWQSLRLPLLHSIADAWVPTNSRLHNATQPCHTLRGFARVVMIFRRGQARYTHQERAPPKAREAGAVCHASAEGLVGMMFVKSLHTPGRQSACTMSKDDKTPHNRPPSWAMHETWATSP